MEEKNERASSHSLSRRALRISLFLPVGMTVLIWLAGLVVYLVAPGEFNTAVSAIIGISLLIFLVYWTRRAPPSLRFTAILLALPAVAGITVGLISGSASYTLIGVAITFVLLVVQRFLHTPLSYRAAYGRFQAGDMEQALTLINKSIQSRPDFWQSYQLRALIHLLQIDFPRAERDARRAVERGPHAHSAYNTLGQIYLAQMAFAQARDTYLEALRLAPDNALYHYQLGLSYFRLEAFRKAAESFAIAIGRPLLTVEYDLLAHYYLGRSLQALGHEEQAQEAYDNMETAVDGLQNLKAQLRDQPSTPHLALMRTDLADLESRLA